MKEHVDRLDTKIKGLEEIYRQLGDGTDWATLRRIIHKPGYTTVAEFVCLFGMLESLEQQARSISTLRASLMKGAQQVGVEEGKIAGVG